MPQLGLGLGLHRANRALFRGLLDQYAGAAAAYSLRALSSGWLAGDVVEVRPSSGWTPASFTANQVANGEMVDYVKRPGNFTNEGFETFTNNGTGDGFTAINSGGSGFAYTASVSGTSSDVVVVDFDIAIVSGSPSLSLRSGTGAAPVESNLETITTSGSKSITLTATGSFTYLTFSEGDIPAEFTISNVRVSTNDGYVSTWYDQSGNANDATQATTTAQPKIVDAGALVTGGLEFDGVDDYMQAAMGIIAQPMSGFSVFKNDSLTFAPSIWDSTSATNRVISYNVASDNTFRISAGTAVLSAASSQVDGTTYIRSDLINSTASKGYVNGTLEISGDAGTNSMEGITIGARYDGAANFTDGTIAEIIIYDSDQSANRAAIEANINAAYSIYV